MVLAAASNFIMLSLSAFSTCPSSVSIRCFNRLFSSSSPWIYAPGNYTTVLLPVSEREKHSSWTLMVPRGTWSRTHFW